MPPTPTRRARPTTVAAAAAAALLVLAAISGCTAAPTAPTTSPSAAPTAAPAPTTTATATPGTPAAPAVPPLDVSGLVFPSTGAGAVGIASPDGGIRILGQGGTTATVPIASITKVITALVVLEAHPLAGPDDPGPVITLGPADLARTEAIAASGQFTEPMTDGQQVTLRDALAITLLTSANNYAESVASWAFGSTDAYLDAARTWLAAEGLAGTTLADASGLDPGSASTTADLLRVGALAHADAALASIAGLRSLDQADLGTIVNQNILLGENGVDGLKTGSTSYAGFTLLTSAIVPTGPDGTGDPVALIAVVLGTESLEARFETTRALLASTEAALASLPVTPAG
ncbi:D-alanyl-D-alanine carboxypeptidase family protein [Herbiconiux solani]|uniref:D-alanyl-D-alanine carboxypeptidase family protein n=1 Tax=Herbiconiux solani TaxID=661329 RepID=UPI000824B85A|nr:D-alanyl-D-alanine carboxypeptidase [Herbiconiux solani]